MKLSLITNMLGAFVKKHWLLLVVFTIIFIGINIGVNSYVAFLVENSEIEIEQKLSPYRMENGYCFQKDRNNAVSYELREKPSCADKDSSIYKQMYGGNTNFYYVATNQPWGIVQYIQSDNSGVSREYYIEPCAVAINSIGYNSPIAEFDKLYDYVKKDFNVCSHDLPPEEIKTDFHYMERIDAGDFKNYLGIPGLPMYDEPLVYFKDTLWYRYGSDRLLFTKELRNYIRIDLDNKKENLYRSRGVEILAALEILAFIIFYYLRRKWDKFKVRQLGGTLNFFKNKRIPETHSADTEYEVLLHKINPINFMKPYDAEKVMIANNLYSVLIKSKDNETVIKMIEEKAKKELKI